MDFPTPVGLVARDGGYIRTFTGRKFWPLDPRPEDVCIEDIAHALSLSCRWTGHVKRFYSVGQHSIFVCDWLDRPEKLTGLLHDASEAYIADIAKPIKPSMPQYREIEARLMDVIAHALGFDWPMSEAVHKIDRFALLVEHVQLMRVEDTAADVGFDVPPLDLHLARNLELPFLGAKQVEDIFLAKYDLYRTTAR